jgi:hypothetical protein
MSTPENAGPGATARQEAELQAAVAREVGGRPRLHHTVVVQVGPVKEKVWQVGVHEFHVAGHVVYAWHDTSADPARVVVVEGGPKVRTPQAAVEVAVARAAGGEA